MKYELKSILKNKVFIFMLILSIGFSLYNAHYMDKAINESDNETYLYYLNLYQGGLSQEKIFRQTIDSHDKIQNNWLDAELWQSELYRDFGNYYKYRNLTSDERLEKRALMALFSFEKNATPSYKDFASDQYKEEIEKYMDLSSYDFDFSLIKDYASSYRPTIIDYNNAIVEEERMVLERYFYLKENNLNEVDSETNSPWTYLYYSYSKHDITMFFLMNVLPIFIVYIIADSRSKKTLELNQLRPISKMKVFNHYLSIMLFISFIIIFLPNILMVIFQGLRYGFDGLKNPILVYKDGFKSFSTYKNLGYDLDVYGNNTLGLSKLKTVYLNPDTNIPFPSFELENIEFYKFIFYAFIIELFKFNFLVLLGTSIGLNIKNKNFSIMIISILVGMSILFSYLPQTKNIFNPLSMNTGWEITLGGTGTSWLKSLVYLLLFTVILVIVSVSFYKKTDEK